MKVRWLLFVGAVVTIICVGCCAPPILFPKTSASGFVLDQVGKPVPDIELEAQWTPVRFFFYMVAPVYSEKFSTAKNGSWSFQARKVEQMGIWVTSNPAYERQADAYTVSLHNGQTATNVIFRIRRLTSATNTVPAPRTEKIK